MMRGTVPWVAAFAAMTVLLEIRWGAAMTNLV
jgi:hypothetical protein